MYFGDGCVFMAVLYLAARFSYVVCVLKHFDLFESLFIKFKHS